MYFVDNIDLETAFSRLVADVFDDLADFVDAAVRSSIDFEHIDGAATSDLLTLGALIARRRRRTLFAV